MHSLIALVVTFIHYTSYRHNLLCPRLIADKVEAGSVLV